MDIRHFRVRDVLSVSKLYRSRSIDSKVRFDPFPFEQCKIFPTLIFVALSNRFGRVLSALEPTFRFLSLVAVTDDSAVIGFGYLRFQERTKTNLGIFISDDYQGQGVGTRIMENLVETGREHDIEQITLQVTQDNEPAVALYEKYGFEITGETIITSSVTGDQKNAYEMVLDLT